jgi:transglutaminase-like putative cysteine protease
MVSERQVEAAAVGIALWLAKYLRAGGDLNFTAETFKALARAALEAAPPPPVATARVPTREEVARALLSVKARNYEFDYDAATDVMLALLGVTP